MDLSPLFLYFFGRLAAARIAADPDVAQRFRQD
jgi:hypothetical protein